MDVSFRRTPYLHHCLVIPNGAVLAQRGDVGGARVESTRSPTYARPCAFPPTPPILKGGALRWGASHASVLPGADASPVWSFQPVPLPTGIQAAIGRRRVPGAMRPGHGYVKGVGSGENVHGAVCATPVASKVDGTKRTTRCPRALQNAERGPLQWAQLRAAHGRRADHSVSLLPRDTLTLGTAALVPRQGARTDARTGAAGGREGMHRIEAEPTRTKPRSEAQCEERAGTQEGGADVPEPAPGRAPQWRGTQWTNAAIRESRRPLRIHIDIGWRLRGRSRGRPCSRTRPRVVARARPSWLAAVASPAQLTNHTPPQQGCTLFNQSKGVSGGVAWPLARGPLSALTLGATGRAGARECAARPHAVRPPTTPSAITMMSPAGGRRRSLALFRAGRASSSSPHATLRRRYMPY